MLRVRWRGGRYLRGEGGGGGMLQKLYRATLAERAAASLTAFIHAQDLKPGETLPSEARLALDLGVSRPVIREALRALHGKGIIEIVNGKGAIVRPLDGVALLDFFSRAVQVNRASIIELMEVRKGIEVESALLAANRRTPEELAHLQETVATMRAHVGDPDAYTELDVALHLLIAQASHNAMLYHLVESIRESLRDAVRAGLRQRRTAVQLERVQELHEALVAEVARGNVEGAGQAMTQHFNEAVTALSGDEAMPGAQAPGSLSSDHPEETRPGGARRGTGG